MLMKKIEDKDGVSPRAGTGRFNFVKKLAPSRFLYSLIKFLSESQQDFL